MLSSALKTKDEVFNFPPILVPKVPQWSNFIQVFKEAPFQYTWEIVYLLHQ